MDSSLVDAYLARIGAERPARPDLGSLRQLQRSHLSAVPFENLSIHLGEPIVLREEELLDKIVTRRRGGFCYELNGAFAALLTALGYRVDRLSAQPFDQGEPGPPFDHMALRVELDEPWLVDVGFGKFSLYPLRLETREAQADPGGSFTVVEHGPDLDIRLDGAPEYRLGLRPYRLSDFVPTCWWNATSPESHFTRNITCSLVTPEGRVTLSGNRLILTRDGMREEQLLGRGEILAAYRTHFGIVLDRVPADPESLPSA